MLASSLKSLRRVVVAATVLATVSISGAALAAKVAVITPYLAQPGTQFYVEAFQAVAKDKVHLEEAVAGDAVASDLRCRVAEERERGGQIGDGHTIRVRQVDRHLHSAGGD